MNDELIMEKLEKKIWIKSKTISYLLSKFNKRTQGPPNSLPALDESIIFSLNIFNFMVTIEEKIIH